MMPIRVRHKSLELEDPARVLVVGGGPAGAFFAIDLLRRASESGRQIELAIVEKKHTVLRSDLATLFDLREGCNYCAGGLSPRMVDALEREGLHLPDGVCQGEVSSLTVQGGWKNVHLQIPPGRRMRLVYRGSKPRDRPCRYLNFDSFLLESAIEEGAEVITAAVEAVGYGDDGKPWIEIREGSEETVRSRRLGADFVALASGMNQIPGQEAARSQLIGSLRRAVPRFRPPQVRRTLIFELEVDREFLESVRGEVYFADFGTREMRIEMFSIVPKEDYITVAMVGPAIDASRPADNHRIIHRFLDLPSIRRILPRHLVGDSQCSCNPNMTVGMARHPFGRRLAVIGDMAVARLYKDGIHSAYLTATALSRCILEHGVGEDDLRSGFAPAVRGIHRDNRYGRSLFRWNSFLMSHPILSRVLYQSVLSERRTKPYSMRVLADTLWKIVSGDDSYRNIWRTRFRPVVLWRIAAGGLAVTLRNVATELFFGLRWRDFERHPTGVCREAVKRKRHEFIDDLGLHQLARRQDFERMYTIQIRSSLDAIREQLAKLGDADKEYFQPRWVRVERTAGRPNAPGCVIRYVTAVKRLGFHIALEEGGGERRLLYRVQDGFAAGGVLIFDIAEVKRRLQLLTIYVAFCFPRGRSIGGRLFWRVFRLLFPRYAHDVLWNHALCKLKDVTERRERGDARPEG